MSESQQETGLGAWQQGNSDQVWVRLEFHRSLVCKVSGFSLRVGQKELRGTQRGGSGHLFCLTV